MNFEQINAARKVAASVRAAREADREKVLATYPNLRLTTAHALHGGAYDEKGGESFVIALEPLEMGMEPFVAVYDVMIERQGIDRAARYDDDKKHVGLDLHRGLGLFAPDTLIAWR